MPYSKDKVLTIIHHSKNLANDLPSIFNDTDASGKKIINLKAKLAATGLGGIDQFRCLLYFDIKAFKTLLDTCKDLKFGKSLKEFTSLLGFPTSILDKVDIDFMKVTNNEEKIAYKKNYDANLKTLLSMYGDCFNHSPFSSYINKTDIDQPGFLDKVTELENIVSTLVDDQEKMNAFMEKPIKERLLSIKNKNKVFSKQLPSLKEFFQKNNYKDSIVYLLSLKKGTFLALLSNFGSAEDLRGTLRVSFDKLQKHKFSKELEKKNASEAYQSRYSTISENIDALLTFSNFRNLSENIPSMDELINHFLGREYLDTHSINESIESMKKAYDFFKFNESEAAHYLMAAENRSLKILCAYFLSKDRLLKEFNIETTTFNKINFNNQKNVEIMQDKKYFLGEMLPYFAKKGLLKKTSYREKFLAKLAENLEDKQSNDNQSNMPIKSLRPENQCSTSDHYQSQPEGSSFSKLPYKLLGNGVHHLFSGKNALFSSTDTNLSPKDLASKNNALPKSIHLIFSKKGQVFYGAPPAFSKGPMITPSAAHSTLTNNQPVPPPTCIPDNQITSSKGSSHVISGGINFHIFENVDPSIFAFRISSEDRSNQSNGLLDEEEDLDEDQNKESSSGLSLLSEIS